MQAIHDNGPVAVNFEVYKDLISYKSGVYQHLSHDDLQRHFNPFELTNHVVVAVGWGVDKTSGLKYWIVKNSWGTKWGIDGFFWIRRGVDECGFESMVAESFPVMFT